jgi:hypothetical protein
MYIDTRVLNSSIHGSNIRMMMNWVGKVIDAMVKAREGEGEGEGKLRRWRLRSDRSAEPEGFSEIG